MSKGTGAWQIWVDTGGTFTDCLARNPQGSLRRAKVLSSGRLRATIARPVLGKRLYLSIGTGLEKGLLEGAELIAAQTGESLGRIQTCDATNHLCTMTAPVHQALDQGDVVEVDFKEEAPILAARIVMQLNRDQPLPACRFHLATTKSTNALLERKGDRTAFLVTRGFADLLCIGDQKRPHLFEPWIQKASPLHDLVLEVDERMDARGKVLRPVDPSAMEVLAGKLLQKGFGTVAIAFLHADRNAEHEQQAAKILKSHGIAFISCSSELAPFIKILPRAETAVVNAYLTPLMQRYLERVETPLEKGALHIMTSAGGFASREDYTAKDSLLSGPAGGLVGAATVARQCSHVKTIAFDMGGTSTDVARFDGHYDYRFEHHIADVRLLSPSLKIETVAAGGGSICRFAEGSFLVGPESAGASPGPAAYGAGGPLSITDVNLMLGRMDPDLFGIPASPEAARKAAEELHQAVDIGRQETLCLDSMLQGLLEIANERMADAIRGISVREGYDPSEYVLTAFGGAGGQHACRVAEILDMHRILFPAEAGLLSAYGLKHAHLERFAELQVLKLWDTLEPSFLERITKLEATALKKLAREGVAPDAMLIKRRIIQIRLHGQETPESIDWYPDADLEKLFEQRFRDVYGYYPEGKSLEIVSIRIVATTKSPPEQPESFEAKHVPTGDKRMRSFVEGSWCEVTVFHRNGLNSGDTLQGPVLVQDTFSTLYIDTGWQAIVGSKGTIRVDRSSAKETPLQKKTGEVSQAMQLELFTHRFFSLVEEMGFMLERTSISTNVKERLDFSCALLDTQGQLIANAPHIPVHLGAIGLCVRSILEECSLQPGDMLVTNHPAYGGSHLPDVTVISPVHSPHGTLIGYVANRAHHAELGGIRPGSMPPDARNLAEEGVVIPPTLLYRQGRACYGDLESLLVQGSHPSRCPQDNLADLQAQAAANRRGAATLQQLAGKYGATRVKEQMQSLKQHASNLLMQRLKTFEPGLYPAMEYLDDGTLMKVVIQISPDGMRLDFTGTSGTHPGNLNATPAIVNSVVLYVLRLLIEHDIPLNEGLLDRVDMILPECLLNPPFDKVAERCPPVVGGNVETSQRLADLLLKALKVAACSQGTMNNLIFGNERISYYETVGGGAGATRESNGADAVHTHMTNTAITDPEILERRYPVLLRRFQIRQDSGGRGLKCGGNGILRELEFLDTVSLSLITQHRNAGPYGLQGGEPGKPGRQRWIRRNKTVKELPAICGLELAPGERLILETPGGGGYGAVSALPKEIDSEEAFPCKATGNHEKE
ncbi:MAG: hydantoinase B/oxoprolinase family protein [Verrucomicrobiota bacterium]|nr:hydantoinase B/oxoprolinase family protein [Verrucomicrobiota bacterium]